MNPSLFVASGPAAGTRIELGNEPLVIGREGADEGTLGRVLVEIAVLQSAHSPTESAKALHEAAEFYKVDVAAITTKVRQEFAAKEKTKTEKKATPKPPTKTPSKAIKKAAA